MADGNSTEFDALDVARFWASVEVSQPGRCWNWKGEAANGYGSFKVMGATMNPHRFAYLVVSGPIPGDLVVRHKCDNPLCCNPAHLETGTHYDNVMDRVTRDRSARGERNGRSLLTTEAVKAIRISSESAEVLAARYGVTVHAIYSVRERKSWTHVA